MCFYRHTVEVVSIVAAPHFDPDALQLCLLTHMSSWVCISALRLRFDFARQEFLAITFDADEVVKHRKAYPRLMEYEERIEKVTEGLQLEGDGWVTNERYDEVMQRSKDIKRVWDKKALGGPYPFQDGGRSWFLS